jgi:prepilin-type N-terminal cleavage/methylation domain-containing protein
MRRLSDDGFTIVEVLVAMALALVVMGASLSAFDIFQSDQGYARRRNETQDAARTTMDRLARQLRNVIAPSLEEAGALEAVDPEGYSLRFETIDTSGYATEANVTHVMRVRYCLEASNPEDEMLWEQTQQWNESTPPAVPTETSCPEQSAGKPAGGWTSMRRVVEHVTNRIGEQKRPVFTYSSSELPQIITVKTDLYVNVDPRNRPGESELTSSVALRNANRKPVAKFTVAAEAGSIRYRLNASESYDPGGLALTYKWWINGEEQASTSQIYQTSLETPKTEYKIKLEVTNPGGLSETYEQGVTTP